MCIYLNYLKYGAYEMFLRYKRKMKALSLPGMKHKYQSRQRLKMLGKLKKKKNV